LDYEYSIGELRPDLVLIGLDDPKVEAYGYERVREGRDVRRDSRALAATNAALARLVTRCARFAPPASCGRFKV
jgi:hypothetical protein